MKSKFLINCCTFIIAISLTSCFLTAKTGNSQELNNPASTETVNDNKQTKGDIKDTVGIKELPDKSSKYGETPEDSVKCVRNLSLYSEHYRQNNNDLAYKPWQKTISICPQASQNLYIHGARILKYQYNQTTDNERKNDIVDSLMWMYDKRIEHFDREGYVLGRKGVDLYILQPNKVQDVFEYTTQSIKLEGKESLPDVLIINMRSVCELAQAGLKEAIEVFEVYDRAINIIDYNIEHNPENASNYERVKGQCESLFRPYARCETLIEVFSPRFEENPEDINLLEQITSMLDESDCTEEELYYKATRNLHRLDPKANSAFLMGRLESDQGNYNEAVDYYSQAIELYEEKDNIDRKFRSYMLKAELQFRKLNQYAEARSSALAASELKPEDGRPYIMIGEMYADTAEECGDDDFTKRVAYWAAVDKFRKVQNIVPEGDIRERANQLISAYSKFFPDKETIFFHGYEEGDSYTVGCWINETTRVRAR